MFGQREALVAFAGVLLVLCEDPEVRVQQGLLRGKRIPAIGGTGTIVAFLGVPYAAPPVGKLKFKLPTKDDPLKPVMVWIHGGAFYFGSPSINLYGPEYLVYHNVVLVTFSYRLGPFGFLTLENSEVPGNAGLKDQVMALQWVKQNIKVFGGNPHNVTIFGQSAGGASVQYHMLSPMSKGLFHRAISQSGSALHPWAFTAPSREMAFRLGKHLGIETNDSRELLEFLCNAPALDVVDAASKVLTPEERPMASEYPFLPTIDDKAEGEIFLTSPPAELLSQGNFLQVPYITGVNSHEGIMAINILSEDPEALQTLDKEFERVIPKDFPVNRKSNKSGEVAAKIKEFYFHGKPLSEKTLLPFVNMVTDIWFHKDAAVAVEKIASHSTKPVFYYNFAFSGPFGILKKILGAQDLPGAAHADELGYLFTTFFNSHADLEANEPHIVTLKRMIKLWTNFAHVGNPTPAADLLLNVTWVPFTLQDSAYLNIGNELSLEHGIVGERLQFWKDMYQAYT